MLTTENAGAVVAGGVPVGSTFVVKMLKGTHVRSVGRDVKEGDVITVSEADYRFLKPYRFCEDYVEETVEVEAETVEPVEVEAPKVEVPKAAATAKVEGKRK